MLEKQQKRYRRHQRVRAKISGTAKRPRLCVFRSAKHIYAQLIDDEKGKTLVFAADSEIGKAKSFPKKKSIDKTKKMLSSKMIKAYEVGKLLAKKALEKKLEKVVFDRAGYKYHGRVKALAEGAKEEGLKF